MQHNNAETAIRNLVAEIETYLLQLKDPHTATVLEGMKKWARGPVAPDTKPQAPGLRSSRSGLQATDKTTLAKAIDDARPFLHGYPTMPIPVMKLARGFADNHAFASIIGEGCPIEAVDFDLGLFLIAPNLFYRDHHHAAPELYAPLTGPHGWRFKPGDPLVWKEAHEPVWNRAWEPHATMTGDTPFLAIFCWTKEAPFRQK